MAHFDFELSSSILCSFLLQLWCFFFVFAITSLLSCWRTCQISDVLTSSPCPVCPESWVLPPPDEANQSRESGRRRKLWATASNCLLLWDVMYQRVLLCSLPALSPFRSCRSFGWHRWLLFHCSLSARWPPCCRQQSFLLQPGPLPLMPLLPPPVYYLFSLPFSSNGSEMAERFGPDWSREETYRQQLSRHSNVCLGFGIAGSFFSGLPPFCLLKCDLSVFSFALPANLKFLCLFFQFFLKKYFSKRHLSLWFEEAAVL